MFERFKIFSQLWRTGRLALRLVRDPRAPVAAKMLLGATALYLISPLDIVPDWIPALGQADDLIVVLTGLNLFLKACPNWLVREHEDAIDGRLPDDETCRATSGATTGPTIDGRYRRMA